MLSSEASQHCVPAQSMGMRNEQNPHIPYGRHSNHALNRKIASRETAEK